MRRSLTGSSLALLLLVVITMQQAVLGFCACQQSYFAESCDCEEVAVPAQDSCCGDCPGAACSEGAPCDDCHTGVSLDPGDYQWSSHEEPVAQFTVEMITLPAAERSLQPVLSHNAGEFFQSRGSPPGNVPLYLRDSVLRL